MRAEFQADLETVRDDIVQMAELVETAIRRASDSMLEVDLPQAETVIAADHRLDVLQAEVDELVVTVLAREQPVATDLRSLIAALRMSATLERMGDLAEHIALETRRRYPEAVAGEKEAAIFSQMADLTVEMAGKAKVVIETRDLGIAGEVEKLDDKVDALLEDAFDLMLSENWDESAARTIDTTLLARFYERLGDHSVSLVKRIGYLVTGSALDPHTAEVDVDEA